MKIYSYYVTDTANNWVCEDMVPLESQEHAKEFFESRSKESVRYKYTEPKEMTKEEVLEKLKTPYWQDYADIITDCLTKCNY